MPGAALLYKHLDIITGAVLQAEMYINAHHGTVDSDRLYIILIGGNDYLGLLAGKGTADVQSVLSHTAAAMNVLYQAGARM